MGFILLAKNGAGMVMGDRMVMGERREERQGRPRRARGCSSPGDQLHRNVAGRKPRTGEGRKQQRETTKQHERPGTGPGGEDESSS